MMEKIIIDDLDKAIDGNDEDVALLVGRGISRFYLQQFELTRDDLALAISRGDEDQKNYYYLGLAEFAIKDYTASENHLTIAVGKGYENEILYTTRGRCFIEMENNEAVPSEVVSERLVLRGSSGSPEGC